MQEVPTAGRAAPARVPSDGRGRVTAGIFLRLFGPLLSSLVQSYRRARVDFWGLDVRLARATAPAAPEAAPT
jgi:hypothetical protein